jgi:beta-barrel assembly-enhancing protease
MSRYRTAILALVFGVVSCTQLAAPVANLNFVSVDQERQITDEFVKDVESKQHVVSDPAIASYVSSLGGRLAATLANPDFPYTFRVIDDPTVNAFNIGGGHIYVHSGLLKAADSEGQVASVLAHEMGHQIHRHVAKQISREQLFQTAASLAIGQNASQWIQLGASLGITTGQLYFGREAERQADSEMVPITIRAGYDPREALAMFEKLKEINQGDPGRVAALFSSHPPTQERIDDVTRQIAAASPLPAGLVRDSQAFHEMRKRLG